MIRKRCIGVLAATFFLLATAAGAFAAGGIQMGPTLLYPVLSVTETYDDNIGQISNDPESGWLTSISPSLRLAVPVRRFYLNVEGGLEFLSYSGVDEGDSTDWFVGAAVGADLASGLSFKIADKHSQRYLIATQEYGVGEDSSVNTLTAMLGLAVRNALRIEISGTRAAPTFDVSLRRERVETTLGGTVYWKFRPSVSGLVEGSYATYAYDSNTAQDNHATQVALGLTWDVTSRSTGVLKAGYQWKSYDTEDASLGTEDAGYYTVSGGLKHSFTRRTALGIDLSRASQESDFPENPYFLRTAFDANLSQRLTAKIFGRLGVHYGRDKYPNATTYNNPYDEGRGAESGSRAETTLGGNASLGFDATRWLSFEFTYRIETRDSNFDTFDFDNNQVSLSAKAAF